MPACVVYRENGKLIVDSGIDVELLKMMERKYNFATKYIDGNQDWGSLINGRWTGIINQVLNNVSNLFAINSFFYKIQKFYRHPILGCAQCLRIWPD